MKKFALPACIVCFLLSSAFAEPPRDASAIVKEYNEVKLPTVEQSKVNDQAWVRQYIDERNKANSKRNELALELYKLQPDHPRVAAMMVARWTAMTSPADRTKALEEIDGFLKDQPNSKEKTNVLFNKAMLLVNGPGQVAKPRDAVEEFIQAAPKDPRGASLLTSLVRRTPDKELRLATLRRIIADYANTSSAKYAEGSIRQIDGIGKPFDLTFTDAINDKPVSIKGLNGKVVVIDFWATWCGPCVAEMPKMKELYAKYKDKGVEFIGVSLDQPGEGLNKLKTFVAEKDIQWPQYYQGNFWQSDFSQSWGINSIPALFIVDAQGNLHSTEARGKLDTLIAELIKKRDG